MFFQRFLDQKHKWSTQTDFKKKTKDKRTVVVKSLSEQSGH